MSEISLSTLTDSGRPVSVTSARQPMQEINSAYKVSKFGLFHIKLLAIAFTGYIGGILVSNTTSYLLPMAECDLHMNLLQKGLLNAIPFLGMIISSVVAGFLTDAFGRKIFVVVGYGGICFFSLIAGASQTYEVLITAKFFEGLLYATAFSATVTLSSEFCHDSIRDRVMLCQSSFAAIAQIVIPAMSWGVLINDWSYSIFNGKIVLNTWNFYLIIMSSWSLLASLLYCIFIPESLKFLITKNKYDEAREILVKMYRENTRKPAHTFPYANIWKDRVKQPITDIQEKIELSIRYQVLVGLHNVKPMFMKPFVWNLALICFMNFLIMALNNVVRLWFPQLSTIVEHYAKEDGNQDLCVMLDTYTNDLRIHAKNASASDVCVPTKSGAETYINSIILGCVCLLPYFVIGVLVKAVGKKLLLIAGSIMSVGVIIGVRSANTKAVIVALFSISTAISQISISLCQALTVEIFPTTTRTLAISLMMVCGRIGTLVGNIMFPVLLDMGCVVPFYTLSWMMICVTVMSLFLPSKK